MRAVITIILICAAFFVGLSSESPTPTSESPTPTSESPTPMSVSSYEPVTIASDGYPGLIKTWTNYTSQAYRITQPMRRLNLLFLFDRFDLQEGDFFGLCTVYEYRMCNQSGFVGSNCYCSVSNWNMRNRRAVEWNIEKGDPIVVFVAYYSNETGLQDPNLYARGGYRTTVMVKDPLTENIECGSTTVLQQPSLPTDRPAPIYFVSQGYPNSSDVQYDDCVVNVLSSDGIRFTFQELTFISTYDFKITISGTAINGTQVTYNQENEGVLHFRNNATISFNITRLGRRIRFAVYVEPFRVVAPSCPFSPKTYSNTEFDMVTAGYSTTNYDDNLNCQWKMTDLEPNAQLVLEGRSVRLEHYADMLRTSDNFPIGEDLGFGSPSQFCYSHPNIRHAEFSLVTDGLENIVGVNAHVHILDCSNTQSQHSMVSGQTLPLTIPVDNSRTYCQEVLYTNSVDVPKELALTVNFMSVDIDSVNFTIIADGKMLETEPATGMQWVFHGYSNYEISLFASNAVYDRLPQGIQMILSAGPVPIETKSVCDSMEVIESSSKQSDYQEYAVSSCGGRNLVVYVIADQVSPGVITLFNGNFDVNPTVNVVVGEPIVLGELISLRLSTVFTEIQKFTIVISDRFLDNGGNCGGAVKYDPQQGPLTLPIHYPCMAVVYGIFDHLSISSGSMELYGGFGIKDASRKFINGSNNSNGTDVQFPRFQNVFTIRTLEGYDGKVVAKAKDVTSRSSTVQIDEEEKSYYIYVQTGSYDYCGGWQFSYELSTYLQSNVDVFLELLSPLGVDDQLCVNYKCYRRYDGLVKTKLDLSSTVKYSYYQNYKEAGLFARVYASFIVPNTTTVSTTSLKTTTPSTTSASTITTPTTQSVVPDNGSTEPSEYLLMTTVSSFIALLSI